METVLIVFIICYFVYKIMNGTTGPSKKDVAEVVEKSVLLMLTDIKENFAKYETERSGRCIDEKEQLAYEEFKNYMNGSEQMVKEKFVEFKKEV